MDQKDFWRQIPICQKCDQILMYEMEIENGKYKSKCQDCGYMNLFGDTILIYEGEKHGQVPEYVKNYRYDDTVLGDQALVGDVWVDIGKQPRESKPKKVEKEGKPGKASKSDEPSEASEKTEPSEKEESKASEPSEHTKSEKTEPSEKEESESSKSKQKKTKKAVVNYDEPTAEEYSSEYQSGK